MHEAICFVLLLLFSLDVYLSSYTWKVRNVSFVFEYFEQDQFWTPNWK